MPGTTNFLLINSAQLNQENDAAYAADALTVGGIPVDALVPSDWLNKAMYQDSMFYSAFALMLTQKGYSPNDSNQALLAAVFSNILTRFDIQAPIINVPYASNVVFDASIATGFDLTLTGDVVGSTLINTQPGQVLTLVIAQDATGGHNFIPPFNWIDFTAFSSQPNAVTIVAAFVRIDGTIRPYTPSAVS